MADMATMMDNLRLPHSNMMWGDALRRAGSQLSPQQRQVLQVALQTGAVSRDGVVLKTNMIGQMAGKIIDQIKNMLKAMMLPVLGAFNSVGDVTKNADIATLIHGTEGNDALHTPCEDPDDVECNVDPLVNGMHHLSGQTMMPFGGMFGNHIPILPMMMLGF